MVDEDKDDVDVIRPEKFGSLIVHARWTNSNALSLAIVKKRRLKSISTTTE